MAKRRRRRRVSLGASRKDHLREVEKAYHYAKSMQAHAYGSSGCGAALEYLNMAMIGAARADAHMASAVESGKLGRQKTRLTDALHELRIRLAKDFKGAVGRCAREMPNPVKGDEG